jgi:hypothetical protein
MQSEYMSKGFKAQINQAIFFNKIEKLKNYELLNWGFNDNGNKGQWGKLIDSFFNDGREYDLSKKGQDIPGYTEIKSKEYGKEYKGEIEISKIGKFKDEKYAKYESFKKANHISLFLWKKYEKDVVTEALGKEYITHLPYIIVREVRQYWGINLHNFEKIVKFREKTKFNQTYFPNLKTIEENYPKSNQIKL